MKKWISLLLAGVLVSAFMVGCKKEEEGTPETAPATGGSDGKMEEKKSDEGAPPADGGKMEEGKTETPAGETKMDEGKMETPAGETKTEEKKEG